MPEIREFMKQFYILDDWVRQFLIVGEEEALLIDTGVEESHVAEAVRQITSLPVRVVLTHGDHDHAGGLGAFGSCLVHPEDADMLPPEIRWQPLREGDTLECGGYRFEVLHIPGHTPGSIALLDREHGLLLPGDSIQKELQRAVLGLPERQRLVFNMKYFDDMKYEDMAEILGVAVGTLKATYHNAVNKIENCLRIADALPGIE